MKRAIFVLLVVSLCAVAAAATDLQFAAGYIYQGSNPVPTAGWFRMQGGRAEIGVPLNGRLSIVGEVGGVHTGGYGVSNSPLTQFTFLGGPRLALLGKQTAEKQHFSPFVQLLAGAAYASEGLFPQGGVLRHSARAVAFSAGGGVDVPLRPHLRLRLVQAEYLYTHLPDGYDDVQHSYRLGVGLVWHR